MTAAITWAIVMVGLVVLALILRDTWLRTLAARKVELADADAATLRAMGTRCGNIEGTLKDHSDRLLRLERERPAPRRA